MADYSINAVTRRVVYTGSAGTGPYAFSFEILVEGDIAVYFNAAILTLTTDYTVTINANGTGSVTIVTGTNVPSTPTSSDQITIVGSRDIERTTDFVTAGDFRASAINEQLDSQIIMIQQIAEENQRGIRAPAYDPALVADGGVVDMTLPTKASRAGKTLAFDSNGNPVVGEDIGNWRGNWAAATAYSVRDLAKDASNYNVYRCNTAHTSSGTTPISSNADAAKWDLVVDAAYAATQASNAAASAAAASTSETNAASSASAASTSASNAATSESNASTSASNAATSESNAASSASSASTSASAAAVSAATAATYAGTQSVDRFNGDGSTTAFTMTTSPATENNTSVYVSGIYQQKDTYSISGTTLSFSSAPPSGTGNIEVMHMSTLPIGSLPEAGDGSAAAPSISFSADTDTGVYRPGANQIGFTTGGTSRAVIDSSGNVGIGTSAPATFTNGLAVAGSGNDGDVVVINDTAGAWSFKKVRSDNSNAMGVYDPTGFGVMALYTAGTERMRIDNSGNVGIGTTSPTQKLVVTGTTGQIATVNSTAGETQFCVDGGGVAGRMYATGGGSQLVVGTFSNHLMSFYTNSTEKMRIDTSGNVGIGATASGGRLYVAQAADGQNAGFRITHGSGDARMYINSNAPTLDAVAGGSWNFAIAGTERMRLDSSGSLLVGKTSASATLDVKTTLNQQVARISLDNSSSLGTPALVIAKKPNDTTTSQVFVQFLINSEGSGSGQINANGSSSVAFGSYSDERLKENIVDLPAQLENICSLRPVEFDYKAGGHQIGFIAQEMQTIYPDVVGSGSDDMLTITGWSKTEARLVKALQEAVQKIEALEARIVALESN
jgi:hypothetical protein